MKRSMAGDTVDGSAGAGCARGEGLVDSVAGVGGWAAHARALGPGEQRGHDQHQMARQIVPSCESHSVDSDSDRRLADADTVYPRFHGHRRDG